MGQATAQFQDRRDRILSVAARVFAEKGYHAATMRAIARAAQSSLAGLYYYFPSKEEILFAISAHALDTVIARAQASAFRSAAPEDRLRDFVRSHLGYFTTHLIEMKVLSRESESLTGAYREEIQTRKRAYVALATEIVQDIGRGGRTDGLDSRVAALSLFGMMNWIYTWYRRDGDQVAGDELGIDSIAETMSEIFLQGVVRAGSAANATTRAGAIAGGSADAPGPVGSGP